MVPTGILQYHLLFGAFEDILFHRVFAHEPVHANMRLLANTMGPRHGLEVILWVPVALQVTRKRTQQRHVTQT
jgi:hypothetical protein